jgi:hypothetical protein
MSNKIRKEIKAIINRLSVVQPLAKVVEISFKKNIEPEDKDFISHFPKDGLGYASKPQNFGDGQSSILCSWRSVGGDGSEVW